MQTTSASRKIRFRDAQIEMAHGAGGKATRRLIEGLFRHSLLCNNGNDPLGDAAQIEIDGARHPR